MHFDGANMIGDGNDRPLDEQREWLRVTLASIGDAVITTDTDGCVTFMNPVAQQVTGWRMEDASGIPLETVFNIVNEESRRTVENPVAKALREGVVVGLANHTLLIAKDGTERPIDDSAAPIRNAQGEVAGVVLVFRDISERRKAERALQESEERFRLLVEGTRDYAIFMLDPGGQIITWNAGAERIKGYQADEIMGRHFSCFYPRDVVKRGWPDEELRRAAAEGRFEDEGWRVRKDGSRFWANVIITALRGESGELRGFSKITRDLTERRQLERAKLHTEMMADLNRRKDEFLAMLSHELRNPLAAMLNAVQLLHAQDIQDPLQQQGAAIIERQIDRLTRLVDDLLAVSRVTTGKIRLEQEYVDLRSVVEHAVETVQPLIAERRHALSISLPAESVWAFADPTRMEQAVINLLNNAAKYTDEGGRIWLSLDREGQEARLRVRDDGAGIERDLLPSVFDLFTQGARPLDRSQGGLGVGLTIVRRVVELHGGRVEAHSAGLGQGSEFVVRLPLAEPPGLTVEPGRAVILGGRPLKVLVVDDNRDVALGTALLLQHAGHEIRTAHSGAEVLDVVPAYRPDAVLLDLGLPEMDGYEIARRIRQQPEFKDLILIAVSGYGHESDKRRSEDAGCDAHLVKPVEIAKLIEALKTQVRRRRPDLDLPDSDCSDWDCSDWDCSDLDCSDLD